MALYVNRPDIIKCKRFQWLIVYYFVPLSYGVRRFVDNIAGINKGTWRPLSALRSCSKTTLERLGVPVLYNRKAIGASEMTLEIPDEGTSTRLRGSAPMPYVHELTKDSLIEACPCIILSPVPCRNEMSNREALPRKRLAQTPIVALLH